MEVETATLVFYETPHRILEALEDVAAVMERTPGGGTHRAYQIARRVPPRIGGGLAN